MFEINSPIPTAREAMLAAYQKFALDAGEDGGDKLEIMQQAADEVRLAIDLGDVQPVDVVASLLNIGESLDKGQQKHSKNMIHRLADGQQDLQLEGDPMLMTVAALGKGERKSWAYITGHDMQRILNLAKDDMESKQRAYRKLESDYAVVLPTVLRYRTVGEAVRVGAFLGSAVA